MKILRTRTVMAAAVLTGTALTAPGQFTNPLDLDTLDGTSGFAIAPADPDNEGIGFISTTIGDFNGDGRDDMALSIPRGRGQGNSQSSIGEIAVIFGSDGPFPAQLSVPDLDGTNGFIVYGEPKGTSSFGKSLQGADINGDGLDDLLIGSYNANVAADTYSHEGSVYIIHGNQNGVGAQFEVASLRPENGNDGSLGTVIFGEEASDNLTGLDTFFRATNVIGEGDFNGDGVDDLIIGALRADGVANAAADSGEAYLVFGRDGGLGASFDLSALDGSDGCLLTGAEADDQLGGLTRSAGDFNGDGFEDFLVNSTLARGYMNGGYRGETYLLYGRDDFPASIDLSAWHPENGGPGDDGVIFYGSPLQGYSISRFVAATGDINGDGFSDLAFADNSRSTSRGKVIVVFGGDSITSPVFVEQITAPQGFHINGSDIRISLGYFIADRLDFNGDGLHDLLIGAPQFGDTDTGAAFLLFGSRDPFPAMIETSDIDGTNGFQMIAAGENFFLGRNVGSAGDLNADGLEDLVVAQRSVTTPFGGRAFVVFGERSSPTAPAASTRFVLPGDGPGGSIVPAVDFGPTLRVIADFSDDDPGAAPSGGASALIVSLTPESQNIQGLSPLDEVADVVWEVTTDRENWEALELTFQVTPGEVEGLPGVPEDWTVWQAPGATGPWEQVPAVFDAQRGTATITVESLSAFAIASQNVTAVDTGTPDGLVLY